MADDGFPPPIRLMNFVSENQLDEAKRNRGVRVEDGTAQRDRPLFEILKENKDKKDAEFNERFKHRPPKALDDDETEFLDKLEMSRRQYEQQVADDEAQQLQSFQAAVAAQSAIIHELKESSVVPIPQEERIIGKKKKGGYGSLGMIIKVKPQEAKKAKKEEANANNCIGVTAEAADNDVETTTTVTDREKGSNKMGNEAKQGNFISAAEAAPLVSYSDEE